jgi:hypothetical protein
MTLESNAPFGDDPLVSLSKRLTNPADAGKAC